VSEERQAALALLLRQAERRVTARLSAQLTAHGSSLEHWHVLSSLSEGVGRAMSEIGSVVMLPPPSMSKLVDAMVELNLVYRRVDVQDRRRVLVFLTRRGRKVHRDLSRVIEQDDLELQELCGAEGLQDLVSHLARLIRRLDGDRDDAAPVSALA
jgi:MarR family transcriptional regulator, organic hydroperoxide resistance regulator